MPEGIELAKADVDLSSYKVAGPEAQRNYTLEIAPNDEAILSTDELENLLEPGMSPPDFIDKEAELDFIRNHKSFPEAFKGEFIEF